MNIIDRRVQLLVDAGRCSLRGGQGLSEIAVKAAKDAPDKLIVIDNTRALTRGELLSIALALGGALRDRGLKKGAVLAFQLPNWWEACAINLCAALFGYRVVPLMPIYRKAELSQIFRACGVDAVFAPSNYRGTNYKALIASAEASPRHLITVRGKGGTESFDALVDHQPQDPDPAPASDAKLVIFTSGSTGRPKGVMHSHETMDVLIRNAAAFWNIGPQDRLYVPSPVGHVGGAIYAFEFPWITGCTAYLEERWLPDEAVTRIDRHALTFMAGATPFLAGLLDAAEKQGSRLHSLRRFVCGGAAVPPSLIRRGLVSFNNAVVSRAYGSSEVPLVCPGVRERDEAARRAETDGECTVEIRLLKSDGQEASPGEGGEIAVRAPQMFSGYLDADDETSAFTADGFFRMGDLGRLSDGCFLTVTGRIKDIIIRKGENLGAQEIESAMLGHDAVIQCAVIGRPDATRGEMVVAFVVCNDEKFDMSVMTTHLEQLGLARQKFPEELVFLPELPMNTVGKVQKDQLRILADKRRLAGETT